MATMWNNQYYQNPELAGIRKTLANSMIGSHSRDVGDLRGLLAAEKTVEQTMRNRASQGLAGLGGTLGERMALSMGLKAPTLNPAADGYEDPNYDHDAAAQSHVDWRNLGNTLASGFAWSPKRHDLTLGTRVLGRYEGEQALLEAQAEQATTAGAANTALAERRSAQTAPLQARSDLTESILGSNDAIKTILERYGITSTNPEANKVVASLLLRSANQSDIASAISTLNLLPEQKAKLEAETKQANAQAALRKAKTETEKGDSDDSSYDPPVTIKTGFWGGSNFNIPGSLYRELATQPVSKWTPEQKEAGIIALIRDDKYTREKAEAILKFIIEEQTGE